MNYLSFQSNVKPVIGKVTDNDLFGIISVFP